MTQALTFPDNWLEDIEEALAHPEKFRFAGYDEMDRGKREGKVARVVPAFLLEQYDRFHSRAVSHTITKGEHEAAALLNFYVVLKYRLWRAEYDTRFDYVTDITNQPFAITQSTIEHWCGHIDDLLEKQMPIRLILSSIGMAKGATARIAKLPDEIVPTGGRQQLLETVSNLSPAEAHRYMNDIEQKDVVSGLSAIHDSENNRLILEVLVTHPVPLGASDPHRDRHYVTCLDCPREIAEWLCAMVHVKKERREFK